MIVAVWQKCVNCLQNELPAQKFNTWIRPLKSSAAGNRLVLLAPNRFILEWVNDHFLERIQCLVNEHHEAGQELEVQLDLVSKEQPQFNPELVGASEIGAPEINTVTAAAGSPQSSSESSDIIESARFSSDLSKSEISAHNQPNPLDSGQGGHIQHADQDGAIAIGQGTGRKAAMKKASGMGARKKSDLNQEYTFSNFIEGKSNQLARAASAQVANNPGGAYNPLFIYGGVGLGKTHLMHAIGNHIRLQNPDANVVYLHSQSFVNSMVSALQLNAINEFKRFYHGVDALLIDDIQFFANKERSQEEFFHTFNAIFEGGRQIILTCDKYYNQINGLEERLKSRFGWGLSVAVEPPELETRAAILINKANSEEVYLPNEAAMFMAQKLRSNVRELEGSLKKVIAHSRFVGQEICVALVKDALKDLFAIQNRMVTIDNIQRAVSEYYKIKMSDMVSKRRSRSVARPRQMAMCLSKELTNHSLPEIGNLYGGRDHTTVLHACKTIQGLCKSSTDINEDYQNLLRSLST